MKNTPDFDALLADPIIVRAFRFAPKRVKSYWWRAVERSREQRHQTSGEIYYGMHRFLKSACMICGHDAKVNEFLGYTEQQWPPPKGWLFCEMHTRRWSRLCRLASDCVDESILLLEISAAALRGQAEVSLRNRGMPLKYIREIEREAARQRLLNDNQP